MDDREMNLLRRMPIPEPDATRRTDALDAALRAFDSEKTALEAKGSGSGFRLTARAAKFWRAMMQIKPTTAPAIAAILALPIAGYAAWYLVHENPVAIVDPGNDGAVNESAGSAPEAERPLLVPRGSEGMVAADRARPVPDGIAKQSSERMEIAPVPGVYEEENRDRFAQFDSNPVRLAAEHPVSTFSIDVDTASYAFVRGALNRGGMPDPDAVRVEEMINYFPYDWPQPEDVTVPFKPTVTIMPSPWNEHTKLMHIAIRGYEVIPAEKPKANLVFLVDTSGSMNQPNKLPLLKAAFRMLVDRLDAQDTISIVTYAGSAGTALEPTKVADKAKILEAIDRLGSGGRTAGAAGIEQAYQLAENSFVRGGVNRIMLATDGDFNVGPVDDETLKRLIEKKRESGIFLSVLGFGHGNYNDRLMQTLAQNGNGQAFYIDTIAEAQKSLVEEAGSTIFPIARDVKIQVEFNPARVAEYRLIGYETRALNREDFNNDRVDAGDVGAGHSITAMYEITPVGSPAVLNDDLRYGTGAPAAGDPGGEYAFLKLRYKLPDENTSRLITQPVTDAIDFAEVSEVDDDVRFSVAVAAFGQKLRNADATAEYGYDRILELAAGARGLDPYGYRAEFLSLVRIAGALDR